MTAIYEPKGMAREYAPLACNLYRGCMHGCKYCYAPACLRMKPEDFHAAAEPRPNVLDALKKDLRTLPMTGKPIQLCFTCDPYPPESRVTRMAIYAITDACQPVQILTKAGMKANRDFDLLAKSPQSSFGVTLGFTDDADRAEWEPNAAPVAERIESLRIAHDKGIRTWVSIEPVIAPEQALQLIEELTPIVDDWRVGKLNHHPHAASIDWHEFAQEAYRELQACGRPYLIKDALAAYLPQDTICNTLPKHSRPPITQPATLFPLPSVR